MYPWVYDARQAIRDLFDVDDDLIERTSEIDDFLKQDRYYFVTATKGLGKSLVLLAKRKQLRGVEYIIPENGLLDAPVLKHEGLSKQLALLQNEAAAELVWSLSIVLAVFKSLNLDKTLFDNCSQLLRNLLQLDRHTPSDYFSTIVTTVTMEQLFHDLTIDYNNTLVSVLRTVNKSVALFIDNIDECFERVTDRQIWYTAQTALVKAVYTLTRLKPGKFKFFVAIRKEAFLKLMASTEMYRQYEGVSVDLSYYPNELREIFVKNINKVNSEMLLDKLKKKEDPFVAFLGVSEIRNIYTKETEDIFDYICRHTLKRPRDLMEIGRAITRRPVAERDPKKAEGVDAIRTIINETASRIADTYITEVSPHLAIGRGHFDRVFELIDSNVLEKLKLKRICMMFNGDDGECLRKDCKSCNDKDHIHIFCQLYKIGLLGYVAKGHTEEEYVQKFTEVGQKTFDEDRLLPHSLYYLIHPILEDLIRGRNSSYRMNTMNIIGYGRPWKMEAGIHQDGAVHIVDAERVRIDRKDPPFKLAPDSPGLIDKNRKFIPLSEIQYAVLRALFAVKALPILSYGIIAEMVRGGQEDGENEIEQKHDDRWLAQEFARDLRRDLRKSGISERDSIIKNIRRGRGQEGAYKKGNDWDQRPIPRSEVPIVARARPMDLYSSSREDDETEGR